VCVDQRAAAAGTRLESSVRAKCNDSENVGNGWIVSLSVSSGIPRADRKRRLLQPFPCLRPEPVGAGQYIAVGAEVTIASSRQERIDAAHAILDVPFWGAAAAIKHATPRIRPGGSIGLTTGTVGQRPVPGAALAAAGAGATEGLVRGLAVELAPIRVNTVRAGAVRTPLWDGVPDAQRDALFARLAQRTLTKTIGEPKQIAAAQIYLMQNQYGRSQVVQLGGDAAIAFVGCTCRAAAFGTIEAPKE
jgi:NAD(P)-dependent dehydrogenase (short-subunit alcohol dehydrogenase family)